MAPVAIIVRRIRLNAGSFKWRSYLITSTNYCLYLVYKMVEVMLRTWACALWKVRVDILILCIGVEAKNDRY